MTVPVVIVRKKVYISRADADATLAPWFASDMIQAVGIVQVGVHGAPVPDRTYFQPVTTLDPLLLQAKLDDVLLDAQQVYREQYGVQCRIGNPV